MMARILPERIKMEFTGERFIPGRCDSLLDAEHRERYLFAAKYAKGKSVLDIACGSGYGSQLLYEGGAASVTGVDLSEEAIAYATDHYSQRIKFITDNAENFQSGCYDLIVSFETLEHLDERDKFLDNLHAMLKENGLLIISTPNKVITSPMKSPENIRNHYHKYEYREKEFQEALKRSGFSITERYGQHLYPWTFNNEIYSRLFRRHRKITPKTAIVSHYTHGTPPKYFVFVACKKQESALDTIYG
jgi:2-polyprenyl-3-methyl-5-hydroxy-6-metoxy-1,4-benzoquinol methylase